LLSQNDQEIAERVFGEADEVSRSDDRQEVNKALNALERVAAQVTSAMLNPAKDNTSKEAEDLR
jgi:hypothetical protein